MKTIRKLEKLKETLKYFKVEIDFSWNLKEEKIIQYVKNFRHISSINKNFIILSIKNLQDNHNISSYILSDKKDFEIYFPFKKILKVEPNEIELLDWLLQGNSFKYFFEYQNRYFSILEIYDVAFKTPFNVSTLIDDNNSVVCVMLKKTVGAQPKYILRKISYLKFKEKILQGKKSLFKNQEYIKIEDAKYLSKIPIEDFFRCSVFVILSSNKSYELNINVEGTLKKLRSIGFKCDVKSYPLISLKRFLDLKIPGNYLLTSRNLFPFNPLLWKKFEKEGIILGRDSLGHPIRVNIFNYPSYNFLILGETGSGKTYFSKHFIKEFSKIYSKNIFIIDPLGDYETYRDTFEVKEHFNQNILTELQSFMNKNEEPKLIIIDEFHLFTKDLIVLDSVLSMLRTSRHFNCSIYLICQDFGSLTLDQKGAIINNCYNKIIFRNKVWGSLIEFGINPLEYGYNDLNTAGGRGSSYSDFFYLANDEMKKLRFSSHP
ncbi:helicase HerA domain-containing protein [Caldiplasma sukawensis]